MKYKYILITITIILLSVYIYSHNNNEAIVISKNNREVMIKQKLTTESNIIIVYNKLRNNDFHEMTQFIIQDKEADEFDFSGVAVMSTSTDFVSPYGILASNKQVNNSEITVGGAHGTEG